MRAFGHSAAIATAAAKAVVACPDGRLAYSCRQDHGDIGERPDVGRAHPADQPLDDGDEQARQRDREEQIAEAHHEAGEHQVGRCGPRPASQASAASTIRHGERNEEPAGLAEVGDLVEGVDQPGGSVRANVDAARVEEQHREARPARCRRARRARAGARGGSSRLALKRRGRPSSASQPTQVAADAAQRRAGRTRLADARGSLRRLRAVDREARSAARH